MIIRSTFRWSQAQLNALRCNPEHWKVTGYEHEIRINPSSGLPRDLVQQCLPAGGCVRYLAPVNPPIIASNSNLPRWYLDVETDLWEFTIGTLSVDSLQANVDYFVEFVTLYVPGKPGLIVHGQKTRQASWCPFGGSAWCQGGLQGELPLDAHHQNAFPFAKGGTASSPYSTNYTVGI